MRTFIIFLLLLPVWGWGQSTILKDVNIIDVESKKIRKEMSVIITHDKISGIDKFSRIKVSSNDTVIDAKGKYLMPGLIDAHIHFFQSGGLYTRPDALDFRTEFPYSKEIEFAKNNASDYLKRYLRLGITTVMDVGGPFWNFVIRDSVARNMTAPNVLVTGPLFSMVDRPKLDEGDPPIIKVSDKKDIDALFEKMLPYQPDFIKVWYIVTKETPPRKTFPLVKYIGDLCRKNNLLLAVHATQLETAKLAVEAGANILVHSIEDQIIPKSFISTLQKQKVTYIPTLTVSNGYTRTFTGYLNHKRQDLDWANPFAYSSLMDLEKIDSLTWPAYLRRIYKKKQPVVYNAVDSIMKVNLENLNKKGINIATGTDAGNIGTFHASSYLQELEAMEEANLSNWDIIVSSTINPAKGFGISDKTGSVKTGKQADLLLLNKNPLEDIRNLNAIELVFTSGILLYPDSILVETPEQIVQRQVNAYNARNVEAFLSTYATDIELYNAQGELMMKGHDQLRTAYADLLRRTPDLYCEIENRMVINNKVIDKEKVRINEEYVYSVAVYEVSNGKIVKVNFLK